MITQENFDSNPNYSFHSEIRMSQRGISPEATNACIRYGEVIHKQSMKFFFITKKALDLLSPKLQEKVRDLVVVTDLKEKCVITCYRNAHAPHRIKKKPKRLSIYLNRD
jgi:hypothetical protein